MKGFDGANVAGTTIRSIDKRKNWINWNYVLSCARLRVSTNRVILDAHRTYCYWSEDATAKGVKREDEMRNAFQTIRIFFNYLFHLHLIMSHRIQCCAITARNKTAKKKLCQQRIQHKFINSQFVITATLHCIGALVIWKPKENKNDKNKFLKFFFFYLWSKGRSWLQMATVRALAAHNQCVVQNGDRSSLHELCNFFCEKKKTVIKDLKIALLEVFSIRLLLAITAARHIHLPPCHFSSIRWPMLARTCEKCSNKIESERIC